MNIKSCRGQMQGKLMTENEAKKGALRTGSEGRYHAEPV